MVALASDEVAIWYAWTTTLARQQVALLKQTLSDDERDRCDKLAFEDDRRDYVAAHALLRSMLTCYGAFAPADWRFEVGRNGKPRMHPAQCSGTPLSFNLSHTKGLAACAVAHQADVGIDVEQIGAASGAAEIADGFFAPAEAAALKACGPELLPIRFVEFWTLKEAYLKATADGLSLALDSFEFAFEGSSGLQFRAPQGREPAAWHFALAALSPSYRLAVAISRSDQRLSWRISTHDVDARSTGRERDLTWLRSTRRLPDE